MSTMADELDRTIARVSSNKAADSSAPPGTGTGNIAQLHQGPQIEALGFEMRRRHYGLIVWFLLVTVVPTLAALSYLSTIAHDQYSSRVSFSIRSQEISNPLEALSGIGQLATGSSSDADIVYEYIRSQKLLTDLSGRVDLEIIYSKPEFDPVFAYSPGQPIEELLKYWRRMTDVTYDPSTGLIDVEVFAFDPNDAKVIAAAVLEASGDLVNELSSIARADTTRHAEYELEQARERLKDARLKIRKLRDSEGIVDPRVNLESQMGILTALQQQLATELINFDLLAETTGSADPRLEQANRKIDAIRDRINQERDKIASGNDSSDRALAAIVGNFEVLVVDREFAEQAYTAAAAAYDTALSEARRKSRYLAAHVPPTIAESSQYPRTVLICLVVFGLGLLFWIVTTLGFYAARDRR